MALTSISSLAASVVWTEMEPASAYFVTFTRVWELGAGALLAILSLRAPRFFVAETLRAVGLLAIAAAFFLFGEDTAFPGSAALVPVFGAVAVIASGPAQSARGGLMWLLRSRPVQFLGNVSYSAYLWHWPMTVMVGLWLGRNVSLGSGLAIIASTAALAFVTKRYIEDPFRRAKGLGWPKVFAAGGAAIIICVLASLPVTLLLAWSSSDKYLQAKRDVADLYARGCHLEGSEVEPRPCISGPADAEVSIFLVGDSHAASWAPALQVAGRERNWRVETDTKGSCGLLVVPLRQGGRTNSTCFEWGQRVLLRIAEERPDLVLLTMRSRSRRPSKGTLEDAVLATARKILETGARVAIIAATPEQAQNPVECALADSRCATPIDRALEKDPLLKVHEMDPEIPLINLNEKFCPAGSCPVVLDDIVVWRDSHHFTASFSRTLASSFGDEVARALD
jgi:hypothetical protein